MRVISGTSMAALDLRARQEGGIPGLLLMENAGQNGWREFTARFRNRIDLGTPLLFVSGKGNNGGDALVMARAAALDGYLHPSVLLLRSEAESGEAVRLHSSICRAYGIPVFSMKEDRDAALSIIGNAGVIFDAVTGTGLKGPLREDAAALVTFLNGSDAIKIAVDIPSGLGDGITVTENSVVFRADCTLAMEMIKLPFLSSEGRKLSGALAVVPVGYPRGMVEAADFCADYFLPDEVSPPVLSRHAYKNSRGHLLVAGGAAGTEGAPLLCARGAAKSGAGLVSLMLDDAVAARCGVETSGIMIRAGYSFDFSFADAAVVGPGWGKSEDRMEVFERIIAGVPAGVIDADGIDLLGRWIRPGERTLPGGPGKKTWIVTPHPGEAGRLIMILKEKGALPEAREYGSREIRASLLGRPWELLPALARVLNAVVVLKSHISHIVSPEGRYVIVEGGTPALGTGGSGDVLAGLCGSMLMHRGISSGEAALAAVAAHQRAGKRAAEACGLFTADELIHSTGLECMRSPEHG
jgi:NAD(P)H-hydrate epimerase